MITHQIQSIQFGILGDEDIKEMSVCEIDKPTLSQDLGGVYDPRMGVCEYGGLCVTCGKDIWSCTGHFGHISLAIPIVIYYKQAMTMLKIFCFKCFRLLTTKNELEIQNIRGYDKIISHISEKISFCTHCGSAHPKIKFDSQENIVTAVFKHRTEQSTIFIHPENMKMIFDNIPDDDVNILGLDTRLFRPKNLVLTKFPVISICCRPRMITPDNISDDDLSVTLVEIVKINQTLMKDTKNEKARSLLKFKTLTYCDNSRGKAVHSTNHKPITGLKERITKKTGHVRQNLMGKRCDKTARTVMGGDPTLRLNEVAIPYEIANIITIPEFVNQINLEKLTELVNTPGKASVIIKKNGTRISVSKAIVKTGTILNHGDKILRNGKTFIVTDCKIKLKKDDIITRIHEQNEKIIPTILPEKRIIKLEVGDKIERFMQNGDFVLLNRQPTLHRNSMQGMKIVIRPEKTMRVNLSIVTGFNLDFDGDEANLFVQSTLESRAELELNSNANLNILSYQSNKPEIVIVQDSLLGAYLMTKNSVQMSKADFQNCIMRIDHDYDYFKRLKQIQTQRNEKENMFFSHALFGFIFPPDFHYETNLIKIEYGIVVSGYFEKTSLKGTNSSLIRILCLEYDEKITALFVDNIQFLTNAFLEIFPFSIGIQDCLIGSKTKKEEIKNTIQKFFLEATKVETSTDIPHIRESRVNVALNNAKDIGLKIAKESLHQENNFISTVSSGSKGDYFNIAQITGLLGQQNLNGRRPSATLNNNLRTLIHFPEVIQDCERKFQSRGFVESSFIEGMHPAEMFIHAMTGREGMTKTSMGTSTSGYIQRSIVKIYEDLKVEYDGTVRDSKKNIYQNLYGGHGFDPSKITINEEKEEVYPVDFSRLATRLNKGSLDEHPFGKPSFLSDDEIDEIVEKCKINFATKLKCMNVQTQQKQDRILRSQLSKIKLCLSQFEKFKSYIINKYHTLRATPGDAVGIICAQSIGERQTQTTLDTFHTAGKLVSSGVSRLEEILNMSKKLRVKTCHIFFRNKYKTSDELRKAIGCSIVGLKFKNVYEKIEMIENSEKNKILEFKLNLKVMFESRINPFQICKSILNSVPHLIFKTKFTSKTLSFYIESIVENDFKEICLELDNIFICGIQGINRIHLEFDNENNEWYIITEGSNLKKLMIHPLIDTRRLYCNDLWEVYEVLGLVGLRRLLLNDLKKVVVGVNSIHIQLLVDKMTNKGKPSAITRYTMRNNEVGPLSKATFEESTDILINAAMRTEHEMMQGVSAAIIAGNQAPIGTGFFALKVDYKKLINSKEINFENCKEEINYEGFETYKPIINW
jgi:DNA-directed RNA polymerase beta' subunit